MGEARLWYEMLNAQQQQLDWAGLMESFRQQHSKFGNTREQYFHAWRSFHFDEATDTIDGYIQKVKQVVALLNYGEPQILELFKNTLPSRLYCMIYQINDLRVVVETAKRLLTKEQMDKRSGQATARPFMSTSQENSKSKSKAEKNEKKVSFSVVEAIERTTDSIERLASLMDKMDTKLDRRENKYRPRIYQGRGRGMATDKIIIGPEICLTAETNTKIIIEEEEITIEVVIETTDQTTGIIVGPEIETITEMEIDTIIDQTIEGTMVTRGMETEIRIAVGLEKGMEKGVVQEKFPI